MIELVQDPLKLGAMLWPPKDDLDGIYDLQAEVIRSVEHNKRTVLPAANKMGKDWIASWIIVVTFVRCAIVSRATSRDVRCRILTTSATKEHLDVLWAEIDSRIQESRWPLRMEQGGPLHCVHYKIVRAGDQDVKEPSSYIIGRVASSGDRGEGLSGHHGDVTMGVVDEASGSPDIVEEMLGGWTKRELVFGNCNPCSNFFHRDVDAGDLLRDAGAVGETLCDMMGVPEPNRPAQTYLRKIIHMPATASPNVKVGLEQQKRGIKPTGVRVLRRVHSWQEYQDHLATLDQAQLAVKVFARFYKGPELMLWPEAWLSRCAMLAGERKRFEAVRKEMGLPALVRSMGVDGAEGGDNTCWCIGDDLGVLHLLSVKTPDTNEIIGTTRALMREWRVTPDMTLFDAGGGGKQHADRLRAGGDRVQVRSFNETVTVDRPGGWDHDVEGEAAELAALKKTYANLRSQMYGECSMDCDPINPGDGFGVPDGTPALKELHRQLGLMPKRRDEEGRLYLPSKSKKDESTKKTLTDILGHSPDEADAYVLMRCARKHPQRRKMRLNVW